MVGINTRSSHWLRIHVRHLSKRNRVKKESSFLAEMSLIKSVGAANWQSPVIPWKCVALYNRNTKIRMCSDKHNNTTPDCGLLSSRSIHQRVVSSSFWNSLLLVTPLSPNTKISLNNRHWRKIQSRWLNFILKKKVLVRLLGTVGEKLIIKLYVPWRTPSINLHEKVHPRPIQL